MNKPKQHRIGCRQQRKGRFRITYDLNVETWINEEVSHGEIIRNVRKVSQSPLPWDTSASDEINELYYLPKTLILTSTKKLVSSCHTPFLGLWNDKPHDVPELNMRSCFSCRRLVQAAQLEGKFPLSEKALSVITWPSTGNCLDLLVFTFTPYATYPGCQRLF